MVCRRCNSHFCWLCGKQIYGYISGLVGLSNYDTVLVCCCSYEHFDRSSCPMFRNEDYFPPKDEEPKEASVTDDLDVLETALVSVCPRCGKVGNKIHA